MKWAHVRAFLRELPFLLFRAFEVAIVLSLLCLMVKGVFSPEHQQSQSKFAAPQLTDSGQTTGISGKLRLRVTQTTRRAAAGGEIPRKSYDEAVVETTTDWFKANAHDIPDPTAITYNRANSLSAVRQQQQKHFTSLPQLQPASRVLAEQVNTLGDEAFRLNALIADAASDMASESAALQKRQQEQDRAARDHDAHLAVQEYTLEDVNQQQPAAATAPPVGEDVPPLQQQLKETPDHKQVMVVTAVHAEPCHSVVGSHLMMQSVKNKADYAQLHGYGFHYSTSEPDPSMRGSAWNKIAVLKMLVTKYTESQVGWFFWLDNDALVLDVSQRLPLERWEGKDLVLWSCDGERLERDHDALAFNGGTLLMRNGPWLRQLLQQLASEYARVWDTEIMPGTARYEAMASRVTNFEKALFEQAGIMDLVARYPEYQQRIVCDTSRNWHTLYRFHEWTVDHYPTEEAHPFVVHFPGCVFCRTSWLPGASTVKQCMTPFVQTFGLAHNASVALLGEGIGMDVTNTLDKLGDAIDAEWRAKELLWRHEGEADGGGDGGKGGFAAAAAAR